MFKLDWITMVVIILAAMPIFGSVMAFVTSNTAWFYACIPILFFLAG